MYPFTVYGHKFEILVSLNHNTSLTSKETPIAQRKKSLKSNLIHLFGDLLSKYMDVYSKLPLCMLFGLSVPNKAIRDYYRYGLGRLWDFCLVSY